MPGRNTYISTSVVIEETLPFGAFWGIVFIEVMPPSQIICNLHNHVFELKIIQVPQRKIAVATTSTEDIAGHRAGGVAVARVVHRSDDGLFEAVLVP